MKKYLLLLCLPLVMAGIFRDDVDEREYLKLAKEPQFDCVGRIVSSTGKRGGSCTLIKEDYVLTAGHIALFKDEKVRSGETEIFIEFNEEKYAVAEIFIHPYFHIDSIRTDLAVLRLCHPVKGIAIPKLNQSLQEVGNIGYGVGFGASGPAKPRGLVEFYDKKIAGMNMIDTLSENKDPDTGAFLRFWTDFDSPHDPDSCNIMGDKEPLPLEYTPTGGDSGGGMFIIKNDEYLLAGVCSSSGYDKLRAEDRYGTSAGWMRVSVYYNWIQSIINPDA